MFWEKNKYWKKITRRQFVKKSLWATSTLLLGPNVNLALGATSEGEAMILPSETAVMEYHDYKFTFTVGTGGIPAGGYIRFDFPTCASYHGLGSKINWSAPQIDNSEGTGFVSVSSNHDLTVDIETFEHRLSHNLSYRIKLIANKELNFGESVIIEYTQASSQGIAQVCIFPVSVGISADGKAIPVAKFPRVKVRGGEAGHIRVVIPSIVGVGEEFKVKVVILDNYGFIAHEYIGPITLQSNGQSQNLPASYNLTADDRSKHVFTGISFQEPGKFVVTVYDDFISGTSNPCWVRSNPPEYKLYWGDLHWHSKLSDGLTHPREGYSYARKVTGLDFTALTDHDTLLDPRGYWSLACELAEEYYEPDEFVTFCSYEWTSLSALGRGYGHKNVYYLDNGEPLLTCTDEATEDPDGLWQNLTGKNAFTIPHHPADGSRSVVDWSYFHENLQPLAEIYQGAGNSEYYGAEPPYADSSKGEPGHYIQDALASGQKIGFVASTDSHYTLPGGNDILSDYLGHRHALPALTAVYAPSLTRTSVMNQMSKRHTYATTGKRIILRFIINKEVIMGDELTTAEPPSLAVMIISDDAPIKQVEIIRDNDTIYSLTDNTYQANFIFIDKEFADFDLNSTHYYYIRVTLSNTFWAWVDYDKFEYYHKGWSSPIWVTKG